ncbi:MAG: DUF1415 domain-containing protein [gamma proteobacterium symbiont of Lucinoma myriamae]|nr:DUF1415 domain-containing protein [gamma proteobacterium symbiont of Lucinoma myriamae]MCU7832900.1 DUF1415 domain-containing protein [gamma proteobacterium symbiont of Lucinoma myriamae]
MEKNLDKIIKQTQCWLDSVIIEHNICPFAKRERDKGSIHFCVDDNQDISQALENLVLECERLDQQPEIETTLFILSQIGQDFYHYLDFLDIANQLLIDQGYESVYQLASFHPDYCFDHSDEDDPANYTNRSPYPTLHIIREKSLEKALQNYPNPELIPERNIEYCQSLGLKKLQEMLRHCSDSHTD